MPDVWIAPAGTKPPTAHDSNGNPVTLDEHGVTPWAGGTFNVPFYFPPEAEDG